MAHQPTVNNVQGGGDSPEDVARELRSAIRENSLEVVQCLLPKYFHKSYPRKKMDDQFKPLTFWAARYGLIEVLKDLVNKYNCKLDYVEKKTGQDLLYIACARGHTKVALYLVVEHQFELSKDKVAPIFAACHNGTSEMVKLLIEKLKCDPTAKDPEGNSLVHTTCLKGHLELTCYLIDQHKLNPESCNNKQETPLHLASASGHLPVVDYLIHELGCNPLVFDSNGLTPLHNAARNGKSEVVESILNGLKDGDASAIDNTGCNPLHLACKSGRTEVVRVLLESGKVDPNQLTVLEQAPIEIARDNKTIKELIKWGAKPVGKARAVLRDYEDIEPLNSLVHIYVIGYEFGGKTTLVKSLQEPINAKAKFYRFAGISKKVKEVIHRTTGIVPIEYNSPDFGKVLLFDFAGQHQFHASHEAMLEYSNTSTAPIFLLVVNMEKEYKEVKRRVNYWVNFIMRNPVSSTMKPHVMVIASHVDQLQSRVANPKDVLVDLEKYARKKLKEANQTFKGFFALDCRDPLKQDALRRSLSTSCEELRTNEKVDVCCHVLRVFLLDKFDGELCCKIKDVVSKARVSEYPLPIQVDRLCELAEVMTTRTKTLFLRNHHNIEESWIVLDIDTLLQKVTGSIFAPENFENKLSTTLQGVLKKSQLREYFPNLDPDMLVTFLRRLDFCQIVSDAEVLDSIGGDDDDVEHDAPNPQSGGSTANGALRSGWLGELYKTKHIDITTTQQPPTPPVSAPPSDHLLDESWCVGSQESPILFSQHRTPAESPAGASMSNGTLPSCEPQLQHPYHRAHSTPVNQESPKPSVHSFTSLPGTVYPRHHGSDPLITSYPNSLEYSGLRHGRHGSQDSLLFFPDLIRSGRPDKELWIPDESFKFYTGWCLECANYEHTFGQRFLTTLHLRLESRFAMKTSQGTGGSQCTIWRNGIHWLDIDGIEVIVEMVDDGKAVLLLMRMKDGLDTLIKGICLRSKVIRKILETKYQYCSRVATIEYLISQSHLRTNHGYPVIRVPFRELQRYNVEIIAQAFLRNSQYVSDNSKNRLDPVQEVILFDPYMGMGEDIINRFYAKDKQDEILEDDLIFKLTKCHRHNADHFSKMLFKPGTMTEPFTTPEVLLRFKQAGSTLAELRVQLDQYSLFAGRNICALTQSSQMMPTFLSSSQNVNH